MNKNGDDNEKIHNMDIDICAKIAYNISTKVW